MAESKFVISEQLQGSFDQTQLKVKSASDFALTLKPNESLSADRILNYILNDVDRTINLGGNLTLANAFSTSGAYALTLTTTAATNITLPTTGTLSTLAGTETLLNKTLTNPTIETIKPPALYSTIFFPDATYGTRSYFNIQQKAVDSPYDSIITFAVSAYGNNNVNSTTARLYLGTLDDVSGTSAQILVGGPETNFGIIQWYINTDRSTHGRLAVYNSSQSEVDVCAFDSSSFSFAVPVSAPRLTTTQKNAISTPTGGMMVFDTTLNKLCVYGASSWETVTSI